MNSKTGWILIAFFLIVMIVVPILLLGEKGILIGIVIGVLFFTGLYINHQQRTRRLALAMDPADTLISKGIVSESTYDEVPAILVRAAGSHYRIHVADSRGSQVVISVASILKTHQNPYDLKRYLELTTDKGVVHFAPRNSPAVAVQPAYAQQVLDIILSSGIPVTETAGASSTSFA